MRSLAAVVLSFFIVACSSGPAPQVVVDSWESRTPAGQPLAGETGRMLTATAKVQGVDVADRRLTVLTPKNETVTLKVGDEVKRLNEVKPGDLVGIQYLEALAFEVRNPTPQEKANPAVLAGTAGKTAKNMPPGAGAAAAIHGIVKVTAIDKQNGSVTIQSPGGRREIVKAKYPENLERVKVGDSVAITYTEAVALVVEPAGKGS